jgi:hypothetical protein
VAHHEGTVTGTASGSALTRTQALGVGGRGHGRVVLATIHVRVRVNAGTLALPALVCAPGPSKRNGPCKKARFFRFKFLRGVLTPGRVLQNSISGRC